MQRSLKRDQHIKNLPFVSFEVLRDTKLLLSNAYFYSLFNIIVTQIYLIINCMFHIRLLKLLHSNFYFRLGVQTDSGSIRNKYKIKLKAARWLYFGILRSRKENASVFLSFSFL